MNRKISRTTNPLQDGTVPPTCFCGPILGTVPSFHSLRSRPKVRVDTQPGNPFSRGDQMEQFITGLYLKTLSTNS